MASTLSRAISCLLSPDSPELPLRTQHRIASWARRCDDIPTIVNLLARPELDDEIDALFADDTRAKVRAAWLSRPGRDVETLNELIARETRETVLTAVASTPGLDPNIYDAVVRRCRGLKPLVAVTLGDAPLEIRCAAIATLSCRPGQLFDKDQSKLASAMKAEPALRAEVLRVGTVKHIVRTAFNHSSDEELLECDTDRILDMLVVEPVREALEDLRYRAYTLSSLVTDAYRLLGAVPSLEARRDEIVALLSQPLELDWGSRNRAKAGYATQVDSLKERPTVNGRPISELRAALYDGPAEARAAAVKALMGVPWQAAAASYSHQLLRSAALDGVLGEHLHEVLKTHSMVRYQIASVLSKRPGLPVRDAVAVAQVCPSAEEVYQVLSNSAEPRRALEAYLTHPDTQLPSILAFFSKHTFEDEALIELLPVAILGCAVTDERKELLLDVSAYLFDRVGDDPETWALFDQLAADSRTSIGDLLGLVNVGLHAA